ncbi:MAG: excinuclease ABC subunit A [Chthoniobacterales bacterium]|nr:excinuclease ABC subunit A [Chthoniobacterales bacterium]
MSKRNRPTKDRQVLRIRGARQNNLRGIDLDLPRGLLHVVTGPSGSGKSSLAFDTIYAEGQRRYIETFSPYTRQFFDRMDKPRVDAIEGIPPAIAIEQSNNVKTTRSTVGTITEINDYLKLLFPRLAEASCPKCHKPIHPETARCIVCDVAKRFAGRTLLVSFPVGTGDVEKRAPAQFFEFLRQQGYLRILAGKKILRADEPPPAALPPVVQVIQDRVPASDERRLTEAVETALRLGKGRVLVADAETGESVPFSSGWHCAWCDLDIRPPTPGLFSFNHPLGACPECRGFGRIIGLDWQRIIPDRSRTLAEGVVRPFQSGMSQECQSDLLRHARRRDIDLHCPFEDLPQADQDWVVKGERRPGEALHEAWDSDRWYGVQGYFDWLETKTYKMHVRVLLSRYRSYNECPKCRGGRFQPETLNYRLAGANGEKLALPEIAGRPIRRLREFLAGIAVPDADHTTQLLLDQVTSRLSYLEEVGLGYLTLDRPTRTLSGGEVQRVNLTTCLGASLVNTLFVMDEPSVGLHPRDLGQLLGIMRRLRDNGNTLLVVEHEETVIRAADWLTDIGPGRGETGGQLMFSGPPSQIADKAGSLTADYLVGRRTIPVPSKRRAAKKFLKLRGASLNNIKKLDADFPLGVFTCVTGVSGSGKSTLVHGLLHRNLLRERGEPVEEDAGTIKKLTGIEHVGNVVMVDQSPPGKSSRSTPVVYLGAWDHIRDLFAQTPAAKGAGLGASAFSFNSNAGRCERCAGLGYERIEMQFLSDVSLVCTSCGGKRFQPHVLRVLLEGKSAHDVLEMTVTQALAFFKKFPRHRKITGPLQTLEDVGLGYLRLGQPTSFLSGGESQRLKLAAHLADTEAESSLLLFDEPTTGLHFDDIARLLRVFERLVEAGHTLVVIEHNVEVIKSADHVIDIGPEAGEEGGQIVVAGTPEEVAQNKDSRTAPFLRAALEEQKHEATLRAAEPVAPLLAADNHRIRVTGAREHNLKNISLEIPRDEFVVVTGLSGSGKSSLAFDILFAEGQRRFLDCMSTYARQFVEQMEKPDVDLIDGLPPAVAIEQRISRGGGKSTVATITEIYHFLRLLYSKLGTQYCPSCNVPVATTTLAEVAEKVRTASRSGPVQVFAPLVKSRKGYHKEVAEWALRNDFDTLLVDGKLIKADKFPELSRYREHSIDVLVGQITRASEEEALEIARRALEIGKNTARLVRGKDSELLSTEMSCPSCARAFEPLDPRMFSFNSPHGWCETCRGFGLVYDSAVKTDQARTQLEADLQEEQAREETDEEIARPCPECEGIRLNSEARHVRVQNHPIADFTRASAREAAHLLDQLAFSDHDAALAEDILPEIRQRLGFMQRVGLDYLTLDRPATSLSGGEAQRIRLAAQLGSNLRGVLYVLDEPTIGLHERDNRSLLDALDELVRQGNSLLVVEHDEETMRRASRIIDLGPGAGSRGGEVIATGTLDEIRKSGKSVTGRCLANPPSRPSRGARRPLKEKDLRWLELRGARLHNLRNLDVKIPLGRLTVACGISGSGKSSLLRGTLVPALKDSLTRRGRKPSRKAAPPPYDKLLGAENIAAVHMVDQSPIGKTSRSTPATYIKVFDEIRQLFAGLPASRMRGYTASRFSFNTDGGRCETCLGQGAIKLEMSFLPSSWLPCSECNGSRYNRQTLDVTYSGKTIADVMKMTAAEAAGFFDAHPKIRHALRLLVETGLGYLTLGQPSPTLSGGEAQRIKLVTELSRTGATKGRRLREDRRGNFYLLEEPTIGLHMADVEQLIGILHRLTDEGHTVVVIEHNLSVIAEADYVIEIGPEAGVDGGNLVAAGTPEDVAKVKASPTAPFLGPLLRL